MESPASTQALLNEAKNELSTLNRVSHRLAMTDAGPQLEKVLSLLLPRLLRRIGQNHEKTVKFTSTYSCSSELEKAVKQVYDQIHAKLVEMMSHVMKRVRADSSCQLPCLAILEIMYNFEDKVAVSPTSMNPFTLNLSLTFLTIGLPRCEVDQLEAILPGLLACFGAHSTLDSLQSVSRKNQGFQIAHLVLRTIEGIVAGNRKVVKNASVSKRPPSASVSRTMNSAASSIGEESETDSNKKEDHLEMVRQMCDRDDVAGKTVYDLLLDVLLYQNGNESGSLPPPGLSSLGKERLLSGNSVTAKNWAIEHAAGSRLKELKFSLLDFIAPCRRFDLFNVSERTRFADDTSRIATSRAVALLVVCSGDQNIDVAERASSYLKAHLDSMRNASNKENNSISDPVLELLGDPIALACELLSAVLGGIIASNAIEKIPHISRFRTTLGQPYGNKGDANTLMTTRRRMVAANNGTKIMSFLTLRVIDDLPSIFTPLAMRDRVEVMNMEYLEGCSLRAYIIGTLTCLCANKYAKSANNLSGLSLTSAAGNPSITAMKLMNSVCVRLAALFDVMVQIAKKENLIGGELDSIHDILARCFSNACAIVSTAALPHAGDVTSPIGVEARDAAYGIICTICRSNIVTFGRSVVFNCGEYDPANEGSSPVTSAKVLFGCVRNETEKLRPRAVAALDSLLAAYCRFLETNQSPVKKEVHIDLSSNPWAMQTDESLNAKENDSKFVSLASALIPLLWNALQPTLPKASRHAAAQWANELLKPIDLNSACHILCFVSGDKDVTAAKLANAALGIDGQIGLDVSTSSTRGQEIAVPGFHDFAEVVFAENGGTSLWRPGFYDFNPAAKGATIRFGLVCLLSDLYGGIDDSTSQYLKCISYAFNEATSSKRLGTVQLLDEASICFAGLLRASQFARAAIASDESLNAVRIAELALAAPSSKARRYLAEAYLRLTEDETIWDETGHFEPSQWKERTGIENILKTCGTYLVDLTSTSMVASKIHGAAYLGASCVRVLRKLWTNTAEDAAGELRDCLIDASSVVTILGRGLLHLDEVIGNACAGALTIAFSDETLDTPKLCHHLYDSSSTVIKLMNTSIKRFGNGDHTDAQRVTMIAKASGVLLSATTVHDSTNQTNELGRRRLECVEAVMGLLGSSANKKDPELALVVGEALSDFADAYSPDGCVWTYPDTEEPSEYDQTYADDLPPHAQVSFCVSLSTP